MAKKAANYGSVDGGENKNKDGGILISTPKVSHVSVLARQRRQDEQRILQAQEAQHTMPAILRPYRQQQQQQHEDHDDTDSLTSFGTASDHDKNGVLISFGSFSRLSRQHSDNSLSMHSSLRSLVGDSIRSVVDATFRLPGKPCDVREGGGTASMPNEVFNLCKNLVGAGALGLSSGVAAFANHPSALVPASMLIVVMGIIFCYYFVLMGRICKLTGTASYREAWQVTIGDKGATLVALFTMLMAGLGNLAYSMILADSTKSLLLTAGVNLTRTHCLVAVTVIALWPLCMVKQLHVLAPFSLVGLGGMVFTVWAMFWRYWDGSYAPGGKYIDEIPKEMTPAFGTVGAHGALSWNVLLLVCMCFQSFFCHYNAPRYYIELKQNTIGRFGTVAGTSFGVSAIMYVAITAFGFLTFGSNCSGFILNNYSTRDVLATICRIAIAIALIFTYPLPFIGCRDGILDLLMVPTEKRTSQNLNVLTIVQLTLITLLAMVFTNLGMVNAVGGALFGTAVVFVFPTLMFQSASKSFARHGREATFAVVLMCVGIVIGATGVIIAVTGAEFKVDETS